MTQCPMVIAILIELASVVQLYKALVGGWQ